MNDNNVKENLKPLLKNPPEELVSKLKLLTRRVCKYAEEDPSSSMFNARKIAEAICNHLIVSYGLNTEDNVPEGLKNKIERLMKNKKLPAVLEAHASTLLIWGNLGAHYRQKEPGTQDIVATLRSTQALTDWFFKECGLDPIPWPDNLLEGFQQKGAVGILEQNRVHLPMDTSAFIAEVRQNHQNILSVGMAFHAGAEWRSDPEKVDLMNFIRKNKIPLRVIVNNGATVRNICPHMQQEGKRYIGFAKCIKEWLELQAEHEDFIQVRISKVPMLHRIYLIQNKDSTGSMNIKYYTYGNYIPAKDYRSYFSSDMPEYSLYANEFEYLWERALPSTSKNAPDDPNQQSSEVSLST